MDQRSATTSHPASSMRLLRTKLFVPRAHPDIVERGWLLGRVDEALRRRLLLVTAPAGFGKTTLLAAWAARCGAPVAWLSLDERDNDPVRFWGYFVAALQNLQAGTGDTALAMLQSPQPPPIESVLTELLNDLASLPGDCVLVLDDYHLIEHEAVHHALTFLLDHLPPPLHLVIAGRADPPLPLPLWRARRALVELSAADLRFSSEEATALFNHVMSLDLAVHDIAALENLTEGWVAGLQLAAIALQSPGAAPRAEDISAFVRSFSGGHRYVFDYLAQEVLSRQAGEVQEFLLRTSVLERLSGPLCDALTGRHDGQALLERLEAANLFIVPLDQQRQWYRYHHLFGDFLRARLEQSAGAQELRAMQRRACDWYAQHDYFVEAVALALRAQDFERAAGMIMLVWGLMFDRSEVATLLAWLGALPDAVLAGDLRLIMLRAWALLASSSFDAVEPCLQAIERALGAVADGSPESMQRSPEVRGALGEISVMRANVAFHLMDLAGVRVLSQRAGAYIEGLEVGLIQTVRSLRAVVAFSLALVYEFGGETAAAVAAHSECAVLSRADNNMHLLLFTLSHLAQLQHAQGHLQRAAETYRLALQELSAVQGPKTLAAGLAHAGLGHLYLEWNDLEQAEQHLVQALTLGRQWANVETLIYGYIGLVRLKAAGGLYADAHGLLDEALAAMAQAPWVLSNLAGERVWLQVCEGRHDGVEQWLQGILPVCSADVPYALESEAVRAVRVLLRVGRAGEAEALSARLLAAVEAGGRQGRAVELLVQQALARRALGREAAACESLSRALALAGPEGYVRVFLDEGRPLADLLAALPPDANAARVLALFPQQSAALRPPPVPALLSERELEVLRLMAEGRTNADIAAALVVSLNTVKTHVKNIHARLDASNRTQAVARARELGLL